VYVQGKLRELSRAGIVRSNRATSHYGRESRVNLKMLAFHAQIAFYCVGFTTLTGGGRE